MEGLILFILIFLLILWGFPVAFTMAGISLLFGLIFLDIEIFYLMPSRIMGIINNHVLIAVPLFIFMGLMLEKSGVAERMLEAMTGLFGKMKGGMAISVITVGALLAASTGIVGATVVTMGLISLPTMLKWNYDPRLATGVIASSGTLGQIIPPSIVLILLGSVMNVSVGSLFKAALLPGVLLTILYIVVVLLWVKINPNAAPAFQNSASDDVKKSGTALKSISAFAMPLLLIVLVLGTIFLGIASPTEAAGVGAFGAAVLTIINRKFSLKILFQVARGTSELTAMVFMILIGASMFALVFRALEGDVLISDLLTSFNVGPYGFLILVMTIMFISGFFIDFIEIIFIFVPVVMPIFLQYEFDMIWIGILLAINLQTSFLTPPFGFALFYLKGVTPDSVTTNHLYAGIVPFILVQLFVLGLVAFVPELIQLLT